MSENTFLTITAITITAATATVKITLAVLRFKASQKAADRKLREASS